MYKIEIFSCKEIEIMSISGKYVELKIILSKATQIWKFIYDIMFIINEI